MTADPWYRLCAEYRVDHGIRLSEWNRMPEVDRDEIETVLRARAESCPNCGVHPRVVATPDEPFPRIEWCPVCARLEAAHRELHETKTGAQHQSLTDGQRVGLIPAWQATREASDRPDREEPPST